MTAPQRLYAMDNLRACMMWLGIVLHATINHMATPVVPWGDSQTSPLADLLMLFIHAFRMPVFFIIAGFFMARLVEQRGMAGMLRNRWRRLGLPLLVFWPILMVATACLVLMFVHLMKRGTIGIDLALMKGGPRPGRLSTLHLWFIVDLLWLTVCAYALHRLPPAAGARAVQVARRLGVSWWGPLCLALPLALIDMRYPKGVMQPSMSFLPDLAELAHFGLFVLFGWLLYRCREPVLARLEQSWRRNALMGAIGFIGILAALQTQRADWVVGLAYNATAWYWSFALLGGFSAKAARRHAWLSYLSSSSYWVYLVHMLGTIGFGVLMYRLQWGVGVKLVLNILATSAACLLSYQLFVRRTWIGTLLNGRTPTPSAPAPAAAVQSSG